VHTIDRLAADELPTASHQLADLLIDSVAGGASVGFLTPLDPATAAGWWQGFDPRLRAGSAQIWVLRSGGRIVGTVGLMLEQKPNGRHRAEVAKLLVHRDVRGRGLGRDLLSHVERVAAAQGRTLLILDTQTGSVAERLYRSAGWTPVGIIPDHAADPSGTLSPTTVFYKNLAGAQNLATTDGGVP
jgi:GNAT superfamily N-acetyltransferase